MAEIAVFFGGRSNEREISVITGMLAVNLLRTTPHRVRPVYLLPEGGMLTGEFRGPAEFASGRLPKGKYAVFSAGGLKVGRKFFRIDAALNCCHGGMGEDGTLSALFEWFHIPSASPGAPMSAIAMDKTLTKLVARGLGLAVAPSFSVTEEAWAREREGTLSEAERIGYPLVVKPARLGSSIGVKVATCAEELAMALDLAFRLDGAALVEAYLKEKRDINCAACRVGGEIVLSPLEEVFSDEDILTFSEKYERGAGRKNEKPARLSEELAAGIREATKALYLALGGRGVVRADFILSGGRAYFNELNTVPGSLACHLFGDSLSESRTFLLTLLDEALAGPPAEKEVLESGILEGGLFSSRKGGKRL